MNAAGYTNREIARELGCSHTRVAQILAQQGKIDITATVRAQKGRVIIETSDEQIVGITIKRALKRAGILSSHKNEEA